MILTIPIDPSWLGHPEPLDRIVIARKRGWEKSEEARSLSLAFVALGRLIVAASITLKPIPEGHCGN
jgi:hypothetical protein